MKLFRYTCGHDDYYGPADDKKDAYDRRTEVDPAFHYLPVTIEEVVVPGYVISVEPVAVDPPQIDPAKPLDEPFADWDADQLRAWLDEREIKYHSQYGEKKLRDLCKAKYEED